jgi:hypothetical protein
MVKSREPLILKDLTKLIGLVLNPFIIGALGPGALGPGALIISISQGSQVAAIGKSYASC